MARVNWKDREVIEGVANQSTSTADLLRRLGLSTAGANFRTAKKWLKAHGISVDHFEEPFAKIRDSGISRTVSDDIVFCEQSPVTQSVLRRAVLRNNLIEYKCECGNRGVWRAQPLTLQLDHINGVNGDNRLTNLRWLCPNCHTQTTTFAGRKLKKTKEPTVRNKSRLSRRTVERPTKQELEQLLWEKPITHIGKQFDVSDNAIIRWLKDYGITSKPPRGYWLKQ